MKCKHLAIQKKKRNVYIASIFDVDNYDFPGLGNLSRWNTH